MMSEIWQFIKKYEFWVLMLLVLGMYVGEQQLASGWMGDLAFVVCLIAITRLAMHPMWKKEKKAGEEATD